MSEARGQRRQWEKVLMARPTATRLLGGLAFLGAITLGSTSHAWTRLGAWWAFNNPLPNCDPEGGDIFVGNYAAKGRGYFPNGSIEGTCVVFDTGSSTYTANGDCDDSTQQ